MNKNVAIIGGGLTGLVAGYRLSQQGYKITILEKGESLGGLAGGFKINGTSLEKAYHHIFKTDTEIINLTQELGIEKKLKWHESSIGLYYEGKIYPFVTPIELLRFSKLDLVSKLRLGLVALYLQKDQNWQKYVPFKAHEWMKKWCGEKAYRVIWEPLLKGKFHRFYTQVSMAWLWARIHTRGNSKQEGETKEYLGYFEGGFQQIADILAQKIKENGGKIETSCQIESIRGGEKIKIKVEGKWRQFDKCLATIPSSVLGKLIEPKDRYQKFINKLGSVDYLSALIIIFSSKQSLSRYYWHNINDLNSPFLAMIQHTNLIDKKNYQNEHIYYLGSYLPSDHQFFQQSDKELYDQYFNYLQKIFPKFDQKLISQKFLFRFGQAQHVVTTDYPKKIPDYKTPVKNLYLANFSQIFPEDRGTNFAVREGEKVARLIKDD